MTEVTNPGRLTFVGHATVLIEMDGVRIMTDPILSRFLGPLVRFGPPIEDGWLTDIDAVLISHIHHDHLDLRSLRRLGYGTRLVVPEGAATMLQRRGFRNVVEVGAGQTFRVGGVDVEAVPAVHAGYRAPLGPLAECVGYVLDGSVRIYFAGDTELFPEMASLQDRIDLALLPVWGWGPTLGDGHMDPRDAAEALTLLRPRAAIPVHWGTFSPLGFRWLKPHYLTAPPTDFAHHAAQLAPEVVVRILAGGEDVALSVFS